MKLTMALVLLLGCAACIQLGGEPQQQHYYLLTPQAEVNSGEQTSLNLLFDQIEFPAYLDRPQLVTRNPLNEIEISTTARWGEPLQDNLVRVLKENLQRRMSGLRISNYPWQPNNNNSLLLKLTVNQFDGVLGQRTNVDIRWSLAETATAQVLAQNHFRAGIPVGASPAALVAAFNEALDQLSAAISRELEQLKAGGTP
jgi:uncharacterized lipoprotein YmbA